MMLWRCAITILIMKQKIRKKEQSDDDSLFGLLYSYKNLFSYIMVLESEDKELLAVIIAKNPAVFDEMLQSRYERYKPVRKIKIGVARLFVKYISPEYIIKYYGPQLGIKIPENAVQIINNLDSGYFILETPIDFKEQVLQCIKRIANMTPQKKYEIIEKNLADEEVMT